MCDEEPRLRAADLERLAAERLKELQDRGETLHPVVSRSRKLAAHFWGSAWMKHLARCESGGLCLAPGRSLLRRGCVLDVRVAPGSIRALVSAERLYEVEIGIAPLDEERQETLRTMCSGRIASLLSLLDGTTDAALLEQLCDLDTGLLPEPADWHMSCTCPDWAEPCPHAAAAVYAVGCLIDADPSLLFTLRQVQPETLIAAPSTAAEDFDAGKLSATFCIDLDLE